MKREGNPREDRAETTCPECNKIMAVDSVKAHIQECGKYVPTYINNVNRCMGLFTPNYLHFLNAEMDIIKETIMRKIREEKESQSQAKQVHKSLIKEASDKQKLQVNASDKSKKQSSAVTNQTSKKSNAGVDFRKEMIELSEKQHKLNGKNNYPQKMDIEGTLLLDQDQIFMDEERLSKEEKIACIYPACKDPVSSNRVDKFTYLDECLHAICLFCFRDYVRNNFVRQKGEVKCPGKECNELIPYIQVKQILDADVLAKLQNQLNSKSLGLIECKKCHQVYQFQKGKPGDAPKKTAEGKSLSPSMAKHYAQNRFQCQKCKTEQCKECKEMPYHLGFNCEDFQEHKSKKKCRYCHAVLPKGYMNETGIMTFDDICDSQDCSNQTKQACSKTHRCGHPCYGYIRQKKCLPCLNQKCALLNSEELHGENQNSYCSLCYVEVLSEAPCVRSNCGHIFHFKCLKKRLELKWETARISFRFCECPLCNQWLQLPEESPLTKTLQAFRQLFTKIKEKALKRLDHEEANKDAALKDPSSPYFKNEQKYAMAIYAYFQCFTCHEPYFGGRKSCAQAMGDKEEKFNPKELICAGCCPVQVTDCKRHGKEYISFKCRFCCEVAQWFCWGNTHFCDGCHKRQINGEYISRIPKDKLPQCQGKGKCPVGGEHGGNGEEFCLGCGVCRGERMDIKDF